MRHANVKAFLDYYANLDDAVEEAVRGVGRNKSRNSDHPHPAEEANPD